MSKDAEQRFKTALTDVMASRRGRSFVHSVLTACAMGENPLHEIPHVMGFNVGKQDVGRWLTDNIYSLCPEFYETMLREAREDEENDRGNTSDDDGTADDSGG